MHIRGNDIPWALTLPHFSITVERSGTRRLAGIGSDVFSIFSAIVMNLSWMPLHSADRSVSICLFEQCSPIGFTPYWFNYGSGVPDILKDDIKRALWCPMRTWCRIKYKERTQNTSFWIFKVSEGEGCWLTTSGASPDNCVPYKLMNQSRMWKGLHNAERRGNMYARLAFSETGASMIATIAWKNVPVRILSPCLLFLTNPLMWNTLWFGEIN
jgi:hypothetical protein